MLTLLSVLALFGVQMVRAVKPATEEPRVELGPRDEIYLAMDRLFSFDTKDIISFTSYNEKVKVVDVSGKVLKPSLFLNSSAIGTVKDQAIKVTAKAENGTTAQTTLHLTINSNYTGTPFLNQSYKVPKSTFLYRSF